jgi:UDP-N-acetylmuramyl pentapeptide phosphotransferase/UDP-N-acetylglucosamine-1-phosphate transferase
VIAGFPPVSDAASAAVAAVVSALAVGLLLRWAHRLPGDAPNARSLHQRPVPRVGGIAIWAGYLPAMWAGGFAPPAGTLGWVALGSVAAVSLADDRRGVHAGVRLAIHAGAAALVAFALVGASGTAAVALAALAIAWSANLYNFMDGSDGLAGAMAVCGFGTLAAGAALGGAPAGPYFVVAASTLPFLCVNWPPARMFMGDVGSVPLGFLAAASGVAGCAANVWPAWFPLLAFMPFVVDATATLLRRLLRRERLWQAHRSHYYQRFHQLGAGHRGTLAVAVVLFVGTGGSAVVTRVVDGPGWVVAAVWLGLFATLFAAIDYHWRTQRSRIR